MKIMIKIKNWFIEWLRRELQVGYGFAGIDIGSRQTTIVIISRVGGGYVRILDCRVNNQQDLDRIFRTMQGYIQPWDVVRDSPRGWRPPMTEPTIEGIAEKAARELEEIQVRINKQWLKARPTERPKLEYWSYDPKVRKKYRIAIITSAIEEATEAQAGEIERLKLVENAYHKFLKLYNETHGTQEKT